MKILFIIVFVITFIALLPISIKNRIKWQKEKIQKKANSLGYGKLF